MMKLIGAGCPRTGTLSTHGALTRLGYPCYHMAEVAMSEEHTRLWYAFLIDGKPMDWRALFANYEATVDAPAAFFYREILEVFPDAKVLLNLRDPESWYKSYMTLRGAMEHLIPHRTTNPRLDMWLRVVEAIHDSAMGATDDHDACIAAFNAHNRRVREEIPQDRILLFRVQDGWGPLCDFLGAAAPVEPFPHLNEGADTVKAGLSIIFGVA